MEVEYVCFICVFIEEWTNINSNMDSKLIIEEEPQKHRESKQIICNNPKPQTDPKTGICSETDHYTFSQQFTSWVMCVCGKWCMWTVLYGQGVG